MVLPYQAGQDKTQEIYQLFKAQLLQATETITAYIPYVEKGPLVPLFWSLSMPDLYGKVNKFIMSFFF